MVRVDLEDLAASDPGSVHGFVREQAGFQFRDGDPHLPANVRIIDLPTCSPEPNPCEQLRDLIKHRIGNRI